MGVQIRTGIDQPSPQSNIHILAMLLGSVVMVSMIRICATCAENTLGRLCSGYPNDPIRVVDVESVSGLNEQINSLLLGARATLLGISYCEL
jgi:hypothetical protein